MSDEIRMIAVKLPESLITRLDAIVQKRISNRSIILRELIVPGIVEQEKKLAQADAAARQHLAEIRALAEVG